MSEIPNNQNGSSGENPEEGSPSNQRLIGKRRERSSSSSSNGSNDIEIPENIDQLSTRQSPIQQIRLGGPSGSRDEKKKATEEGVGELSGASPPKAVMADNFSDPSTPSRLPGWPTCSLCSKSFNSWPAYFGHLRRHPERPWRGAFPPPTNWNDQPPTDKKREVQLPVERSLPGVLLNIGKKILHDTGAKGGQPSGSEETSEASDQEKPSDAAGHFELKDLVVEPSSKGGQSSGLGQTYEAIAQGESYAARDEGEPSDVPKPFNHNEEGEPSDAAAHFVLNEDAQGGRFDLNEMPPDDGGDEVVHPLGIDLNRSPPPSDEEDA